MTANTAASARTGTLTVAGNPLTVTQVATDAFPVGSALPAGWAKPSGANAAWALASDFAYEGSYSLKSNPIGNSQKAQIEVSRGFASGTVSFALKVSSEAGYDFLRFYIDGVQQGQWSGEQAWTIVSFPVTAGTHALRWSYEKDASVTSGSDAAWIDAVSLPPATADVRSYVPAENASVGYNSYLRVINIGDVATPVSIAVISGATGTVGSSKQLTASLPVAAAITFSAQQVEAALGLTLPAGDRPRIRVTTNSLVEIQSFMSNPGGAVTQISDAMTVSTGYFVRSYVPAANAAAGYTSFIRVINIGTTASPIQATVIDDTTGAAGASGQLISSLAAGAAVTFSAQQIETAMGVTLAAANRPRIKITSVSVPLEVQSFMSNPGGSVTQISGAQSGTSAAVRNFFPAANSSSGYTGYIRVINNGTQASPISVSLLDGGTGLTTASGQLWASLPAAAAKTFSAQQVEAALGVSLPTSSRPRILVTANVSIDAQSFMSNPGGTVSQISGAQSGNSVDVRTYVPVANAGVGYASYLRVINTGSSATAVNVAVINGTTGAVGPSGQLAASLPAGAAITFTAQDVEATLGAPLPGGDRPRIRVTAAASTIDVQSFMSNPGGVITETVDAQ